MNVEELLVTNLVSLAHPDNVDTIDFRLQETPYDVVWLNKINGLQQNCVRHVALSFDVYCRKDDNQSLKHSIT